MYMYKNLDIVHVHAQKFLLDYVSKNLFHTEDMK